MSNPQALFFDTGALVSLFNSDPSDQQRSEKILAHADKYPHASRHIINYCLIEFLHFVLKRQRLSPKQIMTNLDTYGITIFPISSVIENLILDAYFKIDRKPDFDLADFSLCSAALSFQASEILTIDRRDFPIALATASRLVDPTLGYKVQPRFFD